MLKEMYYFKEDKYGFATKLKELIKESKYTAYELAEELGDTYYELVKKWKTAERLPSLRDVYRLSKIFGVSMEELFTPNAVLKIDDNVYTDMYTSTIKNKLTILYNFFPDLVKGEVKDNVVSAAEFIKQRDFKEEINYLFQKKLFSYLTEFENDKLKFYFENILRSRSYDEYDGINFDKLDYESFWEDIDNEMKKRKGLSYKYKITYDEMQEEYYEFKKKLEFAPCINGQFSFAQRLIIDNVVEMITDTDALKAFFTQFDTVVINCIYTNVYTKPEAKVILEELGAKLINIKLNENVETTDDIYEEVKKLSYEEYLEAIGGQQ